VRTPRPPHRIVLGLDGSDGSAHACHWCAALAHSLDAEVLAVHAVEVPAYPLVTYEGLQPIPLDAEILLRWQEDRRRLVESEWCAPLRHAGARYRALVVEGNPATVIMETAEAQKASLIVSADGAWAASTSCCWGA
jgi:nucleotide-binding universal stress UspA family protein